MFKLKHVAEIMLKVLKMAGRPQSCLTPHGQPPPDRQKRVLYTHVLNLNDVVEKRQNVPRAH